MRWNHAHVLRPKGDAYFLYSVLAHKDIRKWTQLAGAKRKKLVQDAMLNIQIMVPEQDEQKAIGNTLKLLDGNIDNCYRLLDKWKELKKGLLQQMFV